MCCSRSFTRQCVSKTEQSTSLTSSVSCKQHLTGTWETMAVGFPLYETGSFPSPKKFSRAKLDSCESKGKARDQTSPELSPKMKKKRSGKRELWAQAVLKSCHRRFGGCLPNILGSEAGRNTTTWLWRISSLAGMKTTRSLLSLLRGRPKHTRLVYRQNHEVSCRKCLPQMMTGVLLLFSRNVWLVFLQKFVEMVLCIWHVSKTQRR